MDFSSLIAELSRVLTRINPTRRSDSRRLEVKRKRDEQRGSLWASMTEKAHPTVLLIWVGFYVAAVALLLSGRQSMPWRLGQKIEHDLRARVTFTIEDQTRTEQAREAKRVSTPNIYTANGTPLASIRGKLTELLELAKSAAGDSAKLQEEAARKGWPLSDPAVKTLHEFASKEKPSQYKDLVDLLISRLSNEQIVEKAADPSRTEAPPLAELVRTGEIAQFVPTSQLVYVTDIDNVVSRIDSITKRTVPATLRAPVKRVIQQTLLGPPDAEEPTYSPLWLYDSDATNKAIKQAVEQVQVETITKKQNQLLVEAGTRLSNADLALLKHEHESYLLAQKTDPDLRTERLLQQVGLAGLLFIVTVGLATYILLYQDRIFQKPERTLGLAGLMILMLGLTRLTEQTSWPKEYAVAFVVMAAALLTIAYNQRFAFGTAGTLAVLVTLASRADLALFLTLITAMGITVFALKEVRTRSKIIGVGGMAGLGALATSMATGLISDQDLAYHFRYHALAAAAAALGAGFIVQGILHYFERVFGVATSMTLLEWCDASRPLLRRLAQEAPGTYSHCVILSQMAEEAAEAIGASGLLTRVGALYHDIGKTQKPDYFVENQEARMNRHDRLAPTMSLLIILGHVKDGVEMAKAYNLPRILHQFIAEHHGTTVVRYFHHAASEAAARNNKTKGRHDRQVPESEFRYPGPKPRSKESAILMICDTAEGAVRALSEPTVGRIESVVHQMVMERLNDGQFDNCDITMRELNIVERSLVKSLCAVHHGRIKYPKAGREREKEKGTEAEEVAETAESGATQTPEVARHA